MLSSQISHRKQHTRLRGRQITTLREMRSDWGALAQAETPVSEREGMFQGEIRKGRVEGLHQKHPVIISLDIRAVSC